MKLVRWFNSHRKHGCPKKGSKHGAKNKLYEDNTRARSSQYSMLVRGSSQNLFGSQCFRKSQICKWADVVV